MTIIGINKTPKPNYVYLDTALPLKFKKGSISVNLTWEQHPTGSINIFDVPETEISNYRSVYDVVGKSIILFQELSSPLFFEISAYADTEDFIFIDDGVTIKNYNISINLRGGHERKVTQPYRVNKPRVFDANISQNSKNRNSLNNSNFIQVSANELPDLSLSLSSSARKISLEKLAGTIGVGYSGYNHVIEFPENRGNNFTLNFSAELQKKLRLYGQIVDFNEPILKTKDYRAGRVWKIFKQDINSEINISKQQPYEYYNTTLSGKDGLPFLSPSQRRQRTLDQLLKGQQTRKNPVRVVLTEGDENPTRPPLDVKTITSLDMNFDFSGPRKTLKKTVTLNGQPVEEELFTYGLAYLAQDIRNNAAEQPDADFDVPALLGVASTHWQLVEYQKTSYLYEKSKVSITLRAKDTETNKTLPVKYFSEEGTGRGFDAKYLTSIKTTGWKLSRFQQEQYDSDSLDSRWINDTLAVSEDDTEIAYLQAQRRSITFRRVPFTSTTQYKLGPSTNYYEDEDAIPFNTQEIEKKELGFSGTGTVIAAVPDPTYVYPMLILEERTLTQSFAQIDHPENILIREERQIIVDDNSLSQEEREEQLKDLKLYPWLTTGEDTYQTTLRKILPGRNTSSKNVGKDRNRETDIYVEYQYSASNQDAEFKYSLQEGTFSTQLGRVPNAQSFTYEYESEDDNDQDDSDPFNYEYKISSTTDPFLNSIESIQYETDDLDEAVFAAKSELELNNFLNVEDINIDLAWFYPEIRPGDYLEFVDDFSRENFRVKSVNFTVEYQDHVNGIPHRICNNTSLNCGKFRVRDSNSLNLDRQDKDEDDNGFDVKSSVRGVDFFGLSIFPNLRTRRNPDNQSIG